MSYQLPTEERVIGADSTHIMHANIALLQHIEKFRVRTLPFGSV